MWKSILFVVIALVIAFVAGVVVLLASHRFTHVYYSNNLEFFGTRDSITGHTCFKIKVFPRALQNAGTPFEITGITVKDKILKINGLTLEKLKELFPNGRIDRNEFWVNVDYPQRQDVILMVKFGTKGAEELELGLSPDEPSMLAVTFRKFGEVILPVQYEQLISMFGEPTKIMEHRDSI
jgi:hypothetical protein